MAVLGTLGWLAGIVYCTIPSLWLIIHRRPPAFRERSRSPLRLVGLTWALMWLTVAAVTWPWRSVALYRSWYAWIPSVALFALGLFLYSTGHEWFSMDQVLGRSELEPQKHEQRLVTTGIRGRLRHPYYLAHFCELLAWSIGTGLLVLYLMLAFAFCTGLIMVRAEDRELEQRFGEEFRVYRRRVPAFMPRLSRQSPVASRQQD